MWLGWFDAARAWQLHPRGCCRCSGCVWIGGPWDLRPQQSSRTNVPDEDRWLQPVAVPQPLSAAAGLELLDPCLWLRFAKCSTVSATDLLAVSYRCMGPEGEEVLVE